MNLIVTALFAGLFAFSAIPNDNISQTEINQGIIDDSWYPVKFYSYDSTYSTTDFDVWHDYYNITTYNNGYLMDDFDTETFTNLSSKFFVVMEYNYIQNSSPYDFYRFSRMKFSFTIRAFTFDCVITFEHGYSTTPTDITNMYANIALSDPNGQSVTFSNVYLNNFLLEVNESNTYTGDGETIFSDVFQFEPSLSSNSSIYSEVRSFREFRTSFDTNMDYVLNRIVLGFDFIPEGFLNTYVNEHGDNEYQQGYIDGQEYGYQQGYDDAYNTGYQDGYDIGYEEGIEVGPEIFGDEIYDKGYQDGKNDWWDYRYDEGYHDGEIHGMEVANRDALIANQIFTGIISIALVPVNFFLGILNFDVFGINIGALVSSLLTVLVLITIIKTIFGSKSGGTE